MENIKVMAGLYFKGFYFKIVKPASLHFTRTARRAQCERNAVETCWLDNDLTRADLAQRPIRARRVRPPELYVDNLLARALNALTHFRRRLGLNFEKIIDE